ncbi:hypothetical protein EKO04_005748 [Ascochyta lentis]|uniref:chitinase n=1 Tax=Ascochyta lentis TaxID=205686 RepID=A0A8H7J2M0_9PLEO|nr:hypothetical protein EKO04_005748 [Ascochyta lentis]
MIRLLFCLAFASFVKAQYNQRWTWVNVLQSNGNWVPQAHWKRDNDPNTPHRQVLFPSGVIELEYNCRKMPAICQNIQNWHNNAALSSWHTQSLWAGWFTYDLGASESRENRGNQRRSRMCPSTWKGTILNPRCPEPNQPRVVPPLYNLAGIGVTAIVPQPIPGETDLRQIIADGKDNPVPFVGQLQSSGRKYTCDEFPPASWIEGGVGLAGSGLAGTTYCAPWAFKCDDDTGALTKHIVTIFTTDITEIEKNLKPLWFDNVDPRKIVMGLAYYGRTYTLADPSCGKMGCSFVPDKGGAGGSCTNFPGILSNREIKRIIKDEGIKPYLNETAMVKYFTYGGNSWVGYDDADTYAMKEAFANSYCLGGIMIWSIDFDDETVPSGQTFTLNSGAATDIPRLDNGGNQNSPQGPGAGKCEQCSFFRLITSTCCGTGGSVGNPVLIPANVATPMDIPLPADFTPPQSFKDSDGNTIPANQPLLKETIIPKGTVFAQTFFIGPGGSLREGEGEDQSSNSSNLVWLSLEIWKEPNPQVQCFFPCTFVLPPYTSFTTTVDYPRITVMESGKIKTTPTFPPLTVSSWAPTTIVVDGRKGCTETGAASCTNKDSNVQTSTVQISSTTSWPYVTYTSSGVRRTTRPEGVSTNGPDPQNSNTPGRGSNNGVGGSGSGGCPLPWPLPTLACSPTGPPPGPGPTSGGSGSGLPPAGNVKNDPEEEDEEEEEEACAIRPRVTTTTVTPAPGTVTITTIKTVTASLKPSTTTTTTTVQPPAKTPDFNKDKKHCYDGLGQWTRRARMVDSADKMCELNLKGTTLTEKWNPGEQKLSYSKIDSEIMQVEIIAFVEVVPGSGCEWKVDVEQCKTQFRKIIDKCDEDGENRKQGGTLSGDCLNWRLDPNRDYS